MPGLIPHLIAGSVMFIYGRFFYKNYFDGKANEQVILAIVCLSFSLIPDYPLGFNYIFNIWSFSYFEQFHILYQVLLTPIVVFLLIILKYRSNTKREPIWIVGLFCIIVHIIMDLFIEETGILI